MRTKVLDGPKIGFGMGLKVRTKSLDGIVRRRSPRYPGQLESL